MKDNPHNCQRIHFDRQSDLIPWTWIPSAAPRQPPLPPWQYKWDTNRRAASAPLARRRMWPVPTALALPASRAVRFTTSTTDARQWYMISHSFVVRYEIISCLWGVVAELQILYIYKIPLLRWFLSADKVWFPHCLNYLYQFLWWKKSKKFFIPMLVSCKFVYFILFIVFAKYLRTIFHLNLEMWFTVL